MKNKTNRIRVSSTVANLAAKRISEVADAIDGNSRLRPSRWPGMTSLYDSRRMLSFLGDLVNGDTITENRITSLKNEIKTFDAVLSPNLSRSLRVMLAEA